MPKRDSSAVVSPNMGLYFDRPKIDIPLRAIQDGLNFRVKNGTLESLNLGWNKFSTAWVLNGSVTLIDNFFPREEDEKLIFATPTDLYVYDPDTDTVRYLTPAYATGTASASGTAVTGVGTSWLTIGVKAGDFISFGSATTTSTSATWHEIANVNNDTSITLTATAGVIGAGPYTIRRVFAASPSAYWTTDVFVNDGTSGDDLWFATNGTQSVVTWNGTDTFATLHPELDFVCRTLCTYSNMMIYGNLTYAGEYLPQSIINSDVGLPLNAGATGTGLSEQFVVHSGSDEILNMLILGDYLIIYSERTIVPTQFIGDPFIFQFRQAISGVGPISPNAIADYGDFHEFIGSDAGYLFDSVTLRETNSHVWRDILRQTDPMRRRQAYGHFDEEQGDLIWSIPNTTDPGVGEIGAPPAIAWSEHYLEDPGENVEGSPFSKRQFPFTATGFYEQAEGLTWADVTEAWGEFNFAWNDQFFQTGFPINLAGDEDGQIWVINKTQTADGEPLPSYVHFGRRFMGSGRERDLLTRIYPYTITLPYDMQVRLYMADAVSAQIQSKGTQNYSQTQPEGGHFVTFYRRGRVFEVRFGSDAGEGWVLTGYDYDKVDGGLR